MAMAIETNDGDLTAFNIYIVISKLQVLNNILLLLHKHFFVFLCNDNCCHLSFLNFLSQHLNLPSNFAH